MVYSTLNRGVEKANKTLFQNRKNDGNHHDSKPKGVKLKQINPRPKCTIINSNEFTALGCNYALKVSFITHLNLKWDDISSSIILSVIHLKICYK